jgi:hypothetical protein
VPAQLTEEVSPSATRHEARKLLAPALAAGARRRRSPYDYEMQHRVKSHGTAYRLKVIRARLRLTRLRSGRADIPALRSQLAYPFTKKYFGCKEKI